MRVINPIVLDDQVTTKLYVDDAISAAMVGLDWQESVLDKDLTAPPGSESAGDRYIVASVATGDWTGKEDNIAEAKVDNPASASDWLFIVPNEGFACTVEDEDAVYYFNNASAWVKFGSIIDHANLSNVTSDQHHAQLHQASHQSGGGDEIANITGLTGITEAEQFKGYKVSASRGSDLTGDGSFFRPFASVDAAIAKGVANGDQEIQIECDSRGFNFYTANIPASASVYIRGSNAENTLFATLTVNMTNLSTTSVSNMAISSAVQASGQSSQSKLYVHGGSLGDVTAFGGGDPTLTNVVLVAVSIVSAGTLLGHLANAASVQGWCFEDNPPTGLIYVWQDFDMRTHKITNLVDGSAAQDAAAFGQIPADKSELVAKLSDVTEIYTNQAGEINGTPSKATPVGADEVLIEDSAATNAKKKVSVTALCSGAPPAAHASTHLSAGSDDLVAAGIESDLDLANLGGRAHSSLTGIGASDHHAKYLDSEAVSAFLAYLDSQYVESEGVQNETGGSYVLKTGASLQWTPPIAGDYLVHYSAEITNSSNSAECRAIVELDNGGVPGGGTEIGFSAHEPETGDEYHMVSGFKKLTLTQAAHRIDWAFLETGGGTARMRRARITARRVA